MQQGVSVFTVKEGGGRSEVELLGQSAETAPGLPLFAQEMKKQTWCLQHAHPGDAAHRQAGYESNGQSINTDFDWQVKANV